MFGNQEGVDRFAKRELSMVELGYCYLRWLKLQREVRADVDYYRKDGHPSMWIVLWAQWCDYRELRYLRDRIIADLEQSGHEVVVDDVGVQVNYPKLHGRNGCYQKLLVTFGTGNY